MSGISKSLVSRLCAEIDDRVMAFLARPIEGDWPYLWIDATYVKVRQRGASALRGVKLAISEAHEGIKAVVAKMLNATWQRCHMHFVRNALAMPARAGGASSLPSLPLRLPRPHKRSGGRSPTSTDPSCQSLPTCSTRSRPISWPI